MPMCLYRAAVLICLIAVTGTVQISAASEQPASTGKVDSSTGYPVKLAGEEIFRIYDSRGATESVRIYEERLLRVSRDPFYDPDLVTTLEGEEGVWVLYRDARVGFVSKEAAAKLNMAAEDRAADIVAAVRKGVAQYHQRQSPREWSRALLLVALATLVLTGMIFLARRSRRWLQAWIEARTRDGLKVAGQRLGLLSAARLVAFEQRSIQLASWVLIAVFVLAYLQVAFTVIPLTRGYALGVIEYLVDPLRFVWSGLLNNVGDFFFIAVIIWLARLLLRGVHLILSDSSFGAMVLADIPRERADALYKIVRVIVVAVTIVMVYPYIPGSSSAAFQGVSLFAGALFTLGASSTASNLIGGIVLIFSGSFRVGDRVKIGDVVGDVEESTLALTRLRTPKNELVTFPNGSILSAGLVNYSATAKQEGVIVHADVTIGYDVPWRKVHELLIAAALRTEGVLESPAPFVLQSSLNSFHVGYQINAYTREANRMAVIRSGLHEHIQDVFTAAKVEILSPAYTTLRGGEASTEPPREPLP